MRQFLRYSIGYFALAVVIVFLTREDGLAPLGYAYSSSVQLVQDFSQVAAGFMVFGLVAVLMTRVRSTSSVVKGVLLAFLATLIFQGGFTLIKTSLPYIVPFYADPFFAEADRVLHGGVDPWELVFKIAAFLPMQWILPFYLKGWILPAIFFPVILAAFDNDAARVRRFLILYVVSWVVLGNVLALAGMSAGPVYYDRLIVGDRFADLTETLNLSGLKDTQLGLIQEFLWRVYAERGQAVGSGISAFPSVHVAIATLFALYLLERSRFLAVFGVLYLVTILFLSVYTGYHYAVDGYISIAVIGGLWWRLRTHRRAAMTV